MKWIILAFKNTLDIKGRAQRKEFWFFAVLTGVVIMLLSTVAYVNAPGGTEAEKIDAMTSMVAWKVVVVFGIVTMPPYITVTIRRLHDIGKSAWWIFVQFIPFIGAIWFIYLMVLDSQIGENAYGVNPKGIEEKVDADDSDGQGEEKRKVEEASIADATQD